MARLARVVVPGLPHHVTQRGNRRQPTFFCEGDFLLYLELMAEWCSRYAVRIWAHCLMPNHVHLIAVPSTPNSLAKAIGEAHRRFTLAINKRGGWSGYLWQGRFYSVVMSEAHLLAAARYIEWNPVRAGLVAGPEEYRWSSARAHLEGKDGLLTEVEPLLRLRRDWKLFLAGDPSEDPGFVKRLVTHSRTGRPLGDDEFIESLEKRLKRTLFAQKSGPLPAGPAMDNERRNHPRRPRRAATSESN